MYARCSRGAGRARYRRLVPLETPTTATADLVVKYDGIRLLATVTDQPPAGTGGISGAIVDDGGVIREFPPQALTGQQWCDAWRLSDALPSIVSSRSSS